MRQSRESMHKSRKENHMRMSDPYQSPSQHAAMQQMMYQKYLREREFLDRNVHRMPKSEAKRRFEMLKEYEVSQMIYMKQNQREQMLLRQNEMLRRQLQDQNK